MQIQPQRTQKPIFPPEQPKQAERMHTRSILAKAFQVGSSTVLSRGLALVRDKLLIQYMGTGLVQDAFRVAFKLPNTLRQIFAEGALSPVVVPSIVKLERTGEREQVNGLMTLSLLIFEGTVSVLCIAAFIWSPTVIGLTAPGWGGDQALLAARLLRILVSYIFFISCNSLFAGALQAVHHFLIPALTPAINNVCFIGGLAICMFFQLPIEYFCLFVLLGGFVQFVLHLGMYLKLGFRFGYITPLTWVQFRPVMGKFIPAMMSGGMMQLSSLVDTYYASYLLAGSITILDLASGFMRIPLGMIGVALSTILLSHFSRVVLYAPKRLSFYLLESAKFILWLTLPIILSMMLFSEKIFLTLYHSDKFSMIQVTEAALVLNAFLFGLFFHSLNKVLLSVYYAAHQVWIPAVITSVALAVNIMLCKWWVMTFHAKGLAIATSVSAAFQAIFFIAMLKWKFNFKIYAGVFGMFVMQYVLQLLLVGAGFLAIYQALLLLIDRLPQQIALLLTTSLLFWGWVLPLMAVAGYVLYRTRDIFNIRLHFVKD